MIPRRLRRATRLLAAASLLTLSTVGGLVTTSEMAGASGAANHASTRAAASTPRATSAQDAISRFGSCLINGGQGDVLVLIDTSASMKDTDPDNGRVTAAKYLVRQLTSFVSENDGVALDVGVAGFASSFQQSSAWTRLTKGRAGTVQEALDAYAARRTGFETDYWQAITGARKALAAKAGGATDHCQALVWLTDGQYDLDMRHDSAELKKYGKRKPYGPDLILDSNANADKVQAAGIDDLCRAGGVADQLRLSNVVTLGVGLGKNASSFGLMKGIATGTEGRACGRKPAQSPGVFVPADGVGQLLLAFDALSDPTHPPLTQSFTLCSSASNCRQGTQTFVLDGTIEQVKLLAASPGSSTYSVYLEGPGGKQVQVEPGKAGTSTVPGSSIKATWESDSSVRLDLSRTADQGWVGAWHVAFVDPDSAGDTVTTNLRLYGDVRPTVEGAGDVELLAGGSAKVELGLVHSDGTRIVPASVTSAVSIDAQLVDSAGKKTTMGTDLGADQLGKPLAIDLADATPGNGSIVLNLRLTTAAPQGQTGTTLQPERVDVPVVVQAPSKYPKVATHVVFDGTDKTGRHQATLPVSGPGCVWLAGSQSLTLPEGVDKVSVTSSADSPKSCVRGDLPLTLSNDEVGPGLASGTLEVGTAAEKGSKVVAVATRYEIEMQRPRNDNVFWPLLVGLTLLGVLLPVGLLYLVKWLTARIPGTSVAVASFSGQVDSDSSFLDGVTIDPTRMSTVVIDGTDRRSLTLNAQSALRTRTGVGLTEPGFCAVDGQWSISSARPGSTRKGLARTPLAVQHHWIALLDTGDPHQGPVEVVFVAAPGGARLDELLRDSRSRVPEAVTTLRAGLADAPAGVPAVPAGTGARAGGPAVADEWATSTDWGSGPTSSGPSTPGRTSAGSDDGWGTSPSDDGWN